VVTLLRVRLFSRRRLLLPAVDDEPNDFVFVREWNGPLFGRSFRDGFFPAVGDVEALG